MPNIMPPPVSPVVPVLPKTPEKPTHWQSFELAAIHTFRFLVAIVLGLLLSMKTNNEWYLAASPLLTMAGKYMRTKCPQYNEWIPL